MKTKTEKRIRKSADVDKKNRLTSGQTIECRITGLNHEGLGIGLAEGTPLLVKGALPDELVRARITFVGRREAFAEVVRVLRKSPVRLAKPFCDKGMSCDGCPLVQMQYHAQLDWKKGLVESFIHRYRSLQEATVKPVLPSAKTIGYRNSAKLVVAGKFAAPLIGIYRGKSHEVIDISDCPLHHPLINRVVQAVKDGVKKGRVPIYSPRSGQGMLRYLVVRVSETANRVMVVFVTARRSFNEIHHLSKYLQSAVPEAEVIVQNVNSSAGNVILGQQDFFVTREQALVDTIGAIRFSISPHSFFQVNKNGAQAIYEKVREWGELTGRETLVDVYCGVGGISLFLAGRAKQVIGIETVDSAVADAEKNARLNGIRNCFFKAGDASDMLEELRGELGKVDIIVLNPPRKGCEEKVLLEAVKLSPSRILYVSCSPQTLARDLDFLAGNGYRTSEIQPVDMFPQTHHVENVARLMKIG